MRRDASPEEVARQLRAISALSREALVQRWVASHGRSPPKGTSRRLLERAAAYQVQEAAFGGLPPAVARRLARRAGDRDAPERGSSRTNAGARLFPGTRLLREWHGRTHTVEVDEDGFLWNGRRWRSLSAVATAITGAPWSGPRVFGL